MSSPGRRTLTYRVTGAQSIDRIDPLLKSLDNFDWTSINDSTTALDFVWETACKVADRNQHSEARILNRLHNSKIIEDKSNLAFLQLQMMDWSTSKSLETYVAKDAREVSRWASKRWMPSAALKMDIARTTEEDLDPNLEWRVSEALQSHSSSLEGHVQHLISDEAALGWNHDDRNDDWWAVKASKGNGGRDVWILHKENVGDILSHLPPNDEYVIQKYITNPLLWDGFKFHFRMYAILKADMSTYLYAKAFILTAGLKYDCNSDDIQKQITNLSLNKKIPGHPGQIPINVQEAYPKVFYDVSRLWSDIVTSAAPFLLHQRNPHHFEFFGLDVVCNQAGDCYLIEANRLPGLESSNLNKLAEDCMYNEMMSSLIGIVISPLRASSHEEGDATHITETATAKQVTETVTRGVFSDHIKNRERNRTVDEVEDVLNSRLMCASTRTEIELIADRHGEECGRTESPIVTGCVNVLIEGQHQLGFWNLVQGPAQDTCQVTYGSKDLWKNLFNWRAFTFRNRNKIII